MLVANNKDYYDWIFHTYPDPRLRYERGEQVDMLPTNILQTYSSLQRNRLEGLSYPISKLPITSELYSLGGVLADIYRLGLIIGNSYTPIYYSPSYAAMGESYKYSVLPSIYFRDLESLRENRLSGENITKRDIEEFDRNVNFKYVKQYQPTEGEIQTFVKEVRKTYKEPIVLVSYNTVTINPILKDLKLDRNIDETFIMNEVYQYIGQLTSVEKDVIIADIDKIEAKGFDNQSFRKRK